MMVVVVLHTAVSYIIYVYEAVQWSVVHKIFDLDLNNVPEARHVFTTTRLFVVRYHTYHGRYLWYVVGRLVYGTIPSVPGTDRHGMVWHLPITERRDHTYGSDSVVTFNRYFSRCDIVVDLQQNRFSFNFSYL
jgi:hypothetical protein